MQARQERFMFMKNKVTCLRCVSRSLRCRRAVLRVAANRCRPAADPSSYRPHHPQLAEKQGRLAELDGGLIDESRAERDAIFADSRNEYLQEQYGKVRVGGMFV